MINKYQKKVFWFIPLFILLLVFISGCVQQEPLKPNAPETLTHIQQEPLKLNTSETSVYTPTGKGWVRLLGGPNISLVSIVLSPVQQTSDGGYIIVGSTYPYSYYVYLLKVDANGNQWNKTYGIGAGFSVQQTSDGGYIITVEGNRTTKGYLLKTDANGNMQWNKTFELCKGIYPDRGYSIQQTSDGGYIVAGDSPNCDLGGSDAIDGFLLKVDANGNEIWETAVGGNKSDSLFSAYQTSEGGYIAFGYTKSFSITPIFENSNVSLPSSEFYLIKTDADGNIILNRTFGEYNSEAGYLVEQTSDRGYVVSRDSHVFKFDENGNMLWNKTFEFVHQGNPGFGSIQSPLHQTSDGGFVAVAAKGIENHINFYLVKFDENGNMVWCKNVFVGEIHMQTSSVRQTSDGGYIITGRLDTIATKSVFYDYLIKTDENGNV